MIKTGTDALRDALRARMRKANLTNLVRDIGDASKTPIGTAAVEAFATASANLPEPVLQALARHLFGDNARLDPASGLLVRRKAEAKPLGTVPTIAEMGIALPKFSGGPPTLFPAGKPAPRRQPAPGWATE